MVEDDLQCGLTMTLLFDGACPLCLRQARWLKKLDRGRGLLRFEDISAADFDAAHYGLTADAVMLRIHGITADGRVLEAMAVFREAYRCLGYGWILGPTGWPILKPLCDTMYRCFARNRMRLSRPFRRHERAACAGGPKK